MAPEVSQLMRKLCAYLQYAANARQKDLASQYCIETMVARTAGEFFFK